LGDCLIMAITFPASPADGATYTNPTTGVQYIYNATDGVWKTYVWPTNTNYLQLTGGTLTGDLALGTNDLTAQDITSTTLTTTGAITAGGNIVMASGNGIDFSATANSSGSMTSELLDDYEEGTWTPIMSCGSASWSPSAANGGIYVKIGKTVLIQANAAGTLGSGGVGAAIITGLPYSIANNTNTGNANYSAGSLQYWSGCGADPMGPLTHVGQQYIYFHTYNGSANGGTVNNISGTQALHFSAHYTTV
jgi:hypothetical protein